jgi:hypothetical protein
MATCNFSFLKIWSLLQQQNSEKPFCNSHWVFIVPTVRKFTQKKEHLYKGFLGKNIAKVGIFGGN